MKRSRKISLSFLGAAPLALVACSSSPKEHDLTYQSLDECISDGKATPAACSTAYDQSLQIHYRQAPRFYSEGSCESEHGSCMRYSEGGQSFWIPAMMGFLAGHYVSSYGSSRRPYVDYSGDYGYRPLYRSYDDWDRGTWSTYGSSSGGSYSSGKTYGNASSSKWGGSSSGRISTSSVSRGGFGSSSSARGGWGGGSSGG